MDEIESSLNTAAGAGDQSAQHEIRTDGGPEDPAEANDTPGHENPRLNASSGSNRVEADILPVAAGIKEKTFYDITGSRAGEPLIHHSQAEDTRSARHSNFSPFRDETDFAFAEWLAKIKCTKGGVDGFFGDDRLQPLWQYATFQNGESWRELLSKIQDGILNDEWMEQVIAIDSNVEQVAARGYSIYYRDVTKAIEFLLGHRPFVGNLSYAPVRRFIVNQLGQDGSEDEDSRLYTEMHTADWWWFMQEQLPENATVIPVLLASDKTQLTNLSGDLSAWPVYLTVGNLDNETRRQRSRPSNILIALIPIPKETGLYIKAEVYHTTMGIITERKCTAYPHTSVHISDIRFVSAIRRYGRRGIPITCADKKVRRGYPILAGITADYEEQVLITGVRSLQQCPICHVSREEFGRLGKKQGWKLRDHHWMQQQRRLQLTPEWTPEDHPERIHTFDNFAWQLPHVNIHQCMMVDILHQLLKGVAGRDHLLRWIDKAVGAAVKPSRKRPGSGSVRDILETPATVQLDQLFRRIPPFAGLKHFASYSDVKQWTGSEHKMVLRQLVAVIAPLLVTKDSDVLHATRGIVNFVTLAQYNSHTGKSLKYMEHYLAQLDKSKEAFRRFRPNKNFDFPKWHSMTHYTNCIRNFGCAPGYSTGIGEANHIDLVKDYFRRTNKRKGFEKQIILANIRHLNLTAMLDIKRYEAGRGLLESEHSARSVRNLAAGAKDLRELQWPLDEAQERRIRSLRLSTNYWTYASTVAHQYGIPDLCTALINFIKQERSDQTFATANRDTDIDGNENLLWAASCPVKVHGSVTLWKKTGDPIDPDRVTEDYARCTPNWQAQGEWRRDHVWVQEYEVGSKSRNRVLHPWDGRLVGKLLVILTVMDLGRQNTKGRHPSYTGAMIQTLKFRSGGRVDPTHGMVEVEEHRLPDAINDCGHTSRRFYSLPSIIRTAHVIPRGLTDGPTYYINNYIDFDQFNTLHDAGFLKAESRAAKRVAERSKDEKATR